MSILENIEIPGRKEPERKAKQPPVPESPKNRPSAEISAGEIIATGPLPDQIAADVIQMRDDLRPLFEDLRPQDIGLRNRGALAVTGIAAQDALFTAPLQPLGRSQDLISALGHLRRAVIQDSDGEETRRIIGIMHNLVVNNGVWSPEIAMYFMGVIEEIINHDLSMRRRSVEQDEVMQELIATRLRLAHVERGSDNRSRKARFIVGALISLGVMSVVLLVFTSLGIL